MKTLTRITGMFSTALILAVVLTSATSLPKRASASCEGDVTWHIWNEIDDRQSSHTVGGQTTDTENTSSRSQVDSDNGQHITDETTHYRNADGSSHEHEESHYSDSEGKRCESDGKPYKFDHSRDEDTDSKGNTKEHYEEIIEKNGKCEKYVRDREWDSKGKLVKDVESRTEVLCSKWSLQVSWEGSPTFQGGGTWKYGPDIALIPLWFKNGTYDGSYEGVFHASYVVEIVNCTSTCTYPVSINVTAKEDEFEDLDFSVMLSRATSCINMCPKISSESTVPARTKTFSFSLPAEDGASKVVNGEYNEEPTWTFTLKKR